MGATIKPTLRRFLRPIHLERLECIFYKPCEPTNQPNLAELKRQLRKVDAFNVSNQYGRQRRRKARRIRGRDRFTDHVRHVVLPRHRVRVLLKVRGAETDEVLLKVGCLILGLLGEGARRHVEEPQDLEELLRGE